MANARVLRDYIRKVFESVSPTYQFTLSGFQAVTIAESGTVLKRIMDEAPA
jgi:hypothetical protein